MKKLVKRFAAAVIVATMAVAMVACGKPSVKDYVESDEVKEVKETFQTQLSGSGMDIDITAEGDDTIVYTFKFGTLAKDDIPNAEESMEAAVAQQDSTFQQSIDDMQEAVSSKEAKLVIKYVDKNDEEIYSKTYTAK